MEPPLVALAEDLEEQFRPGPGQWDEAHLVSEDLQCRESVPIRGEVFGGRIVCTWTPWGKTALTGCHIAGANPYHSWSLGLGFRFEYGGKQQVKTSQVLNVGNVGSPAGGVGQLLKKFQIVFPGATRFGKG